MMGQWTKADAGATANRAARSKHLFGWMELMVTLLDVLWAIGWIFTTSCVVGWGGGETGDDHVWLPSAVCCAKELVWIIRD